MSRSASRARRRARTANTRKNSMGFLDHMRAAEFSATGKHSSLAMLAASNLTGTRATVSATFAAKPSPAVLPHTPPRTAAKPSDMPRRSIWHAATGDPVAEPVAEPVTAPVLATRVHTPIKAAELDKEMRAAAMRIVHGDGPHGWRLVGVINRESGRVTVYVRKHGASVRYSTTD
ncbi:hypothetical protein [Streptomyces sp. NBC_00055]|uniref:hypothetical protein n=1 Tax=Streptomyces sp. NBC_00055 TaxID=2975632 RepID=UPI0032527258